MKFVKVITCLILIAATSVSSVGESDFSPFEQKIDGSELTIKMMSIEGGQFLAGSSKNKKEQGKDEGPVHMVEVDSFWMSSLEISWDLFELFLYREIDGVKSSTRGNVDLRVDGVSAATMPYVNFNKPGHPLINITEYAASMFCKWLTAKTGHFYRLPTEAEWEYACRAGSTTTFSFGNDDKILEQYAWYDQNSNRTIHPGGMKKPNAWGLYDMHGNAAEWVVDAYEPEYYASLKPGEKDPVNYSKSLYPRVVRGGSWSDGPEELRSAARNFSTKDWKKRDPQFPKSLWWMTDALHVGFRIVRPKKTYSVAEMEAFWGQPIAEY